MADLVRTTIEWTALEEIEPEWLTSRMRPRRPRNIAIPAGIVCEVVGDWMTEFPDSVLEDWSRLRTFVDGVPFTVALPAHGFEPYEEL